MSEHPLVVIGAGATGLEVIDIARAERRGAHRNIMAIDDSLTGRPDQLERRSVPLIGGRDRLDGLDADFVVTIGDPLVRRRMIDAATAAGLRPADPIVHPRSVRSPGVQLGDGSAIYPNAVISTDVVVGPHSLVYMLVSLGHDVRLGENCIVTPGVNLSGNVTLENDVFIGTGACVLPGVRIAQGAIVGAGSVVTKNVDAGSVVVGNPARRNRP